MVRRERNTTVSAATARSRLPILAAASLLLSLGLFSCSINRFAISMVSNALSSGSSTSTFTSDNDPALVGNALPFALKLYEVLVAQDPKNARLLLTTGTLFVVYAEAYLQQPADMLPDTEYKKQEALRHQAKLLYLRGRDYVMRGLEIRHPDFRGGLKGEALAKQLASMTKADVPYLFWAAAGWAGAYAINPFDFKLAVTIREPVAMMQRARELDPAFQNGAIPDFFISYYGAAPSALGGSIAKAKEAFNQAVAVTKGLSPAPYVAYAQYISVAEHDRSGFEEMLKKALAIDPNAVPDNRLETLLSQQKARWLLDNVGKFFLSP